MIPMFKFILDKKDYYQTRIDPVKRYLDHMTLFLHHSTGKDLEACREFVKKTIQTNRTGNIKDPIVTYYERDDVGDKEEKKTTLSKYIKSAQKEGLVIAPSFTCYLPHDKKRSLLVDYLDENKKTRSVFKKKALTAKVSGNTTEFKINHNKQITKKYYNNSVSGLLTSVYNPIYNYSGHYTLTSIVRCVSGTGNMLTERMVSGNRFYRTPTTTISEIISLIEIVERNIEEYKRVFSKYVIHIPTVDQVFGIIANNYRRYFRSEYIDHIIKRLLANVDPICLAGVAYIADMYHWYLYNPDIVKHIFEKIATKVAECGSTDPLKDIKSMDDGVLNLAHHIWMDELAGEAAIYEKLDISIVHGILATAKNITSVLNEYSDILTLLFKTTFIPPDIAYLKDMRREVVVLSDTDSTCGTYELWARMFTGDRLVYTNLSMTNAATAMFFNTSVTDHLLRLFTARTNTVPEMIGKLAMKNEFTWDFMALTTVAKHYFAPVRVQEGNVFKGTSLDNLELKGVHLITSKIPDFINKYSKNLIIDLCNQIVSNKKLSLHDILDNVVDMELKVVRMMKEGHPNIYSQSRVNKLDTYKRSDTPERTNYVHYMLWQEVFAPKYGNIEEPPYYTYKIPITVDSKTKLMAWLSSIEDEGFKERLISFMKKYNKTRISTIELPVDFVASNGVPEEIYPVLDYRNVVLGNFKSTYLILETLGYIKKEDMTLFDSMYEMEITEAV